MAGIKLDANTRRPGGIRPAAPATITAVMLAVGLALLPAAASAQGTVRAWGMGDAMTGLSRGLEAVAYNPANLAFSSGTTVGLAGVAVDVNNNALSLDRYNEITGSYLDHQQKEELLADIPESGFELDADVRASALGTHVGNFAVSFDAWGAGGGNLDRDYFDLILFGNEVGETVDFSNTGGEGYAVGSAALSYGKKILAAPGFQLSAGANVRYLQGIYEMHVEDAYGTLTTTMDEISGEAYVSTLSAEGGTGYGMDLGVALQTVAGWHFGLAVDNVVSNIDWSDNVEVREFRLDASEINLMNKDLDEAVDDADTTFAGGAYSTSLPRQMRLGAANRFGDFNVAADYAQGFESRGRVSTTPQLNVGVEWLLTGAVQPRCGVMTGGASGTGVSAGLGLGLGPWQVDLAALTRNGLSPGGTKGVGFAAGSSLKF